MSRARKRRKFDEADKYWARCAAVAGMRHVQPKVWQRRRWAVRGVPFRRVSGGFRVSYWGRLGVWDEWISD